MEKINQAQTEEQRASHVKDHQLANKPVMRRAHHDKRQRMDEIAKLAAKLKKLRNEMSDKHQHDEGLNSQVCRWRNNNIQ